MRPHRAWRAVADHWVLAVGLLVLAYLFLPIGMVVALSFNEPASRLTSSSGRLAKRATFPRKSGGAGTSC